MQRWITRSRQLFITMPPAWAVVCSVIACIVFELPRYIASRLADADILQSTKMIGSEIPILLSAWAYGFWRVAAFSPFFLLSYRNWLETTPWTWREPLPLGPVRLVWQDVLIPSVLVAACLIQPAVNLWFAPLAVLICAGAYMATATFQIALTCRWLYAYSILFSIGLLLLAFAAYSFLWFTVTFIGIGVLVWFGIASSLSAFPWSVSLDEHRAVRFRQPKEESASWPHDLLRPDPQPLGIPHPHGLLLGLLGGWLTFAITMAAVSRGEPVGDASWVPMFAGLCVFFCRTVVYKANYASPLGLWARVQTGRWIIRDHDRVFLPQLISLVAGVLGSVLMQRTLPLLWLSASVAICLACGLGLGPTRREWMLLGHHRLRTQWYRAGELRKV